MIRRFGVLPLVASVTLAACADLLAIPEDPYLEEQVPQPTMREPQPPALDADEPSAAAPGAPSTDDAAESAGGEGAALDRPSVVPLAGADDDATETGGAQAGASSDAPASASEPDDSAEPSASEPDATEPDDAEPDDAEPDATDASEPDDVQPPSAPAAPPCAPARRPVDILLVADNSASMSAELDALERGLNGFAAELDEGGVDYRLIVLSRQRTAARNSSELASTALCVPPPLGALASCPALAPGASARFLHYDVPIAESDALDRILDTFAAPDPHGLAPTGWSERLRIGAEKVVIALSDGDAARPLQDFLVELSFLAPEQFGSDPAAPGFVFHSVIGLRQPAFAAAAYAPLEPIEPVACGAPPDDNAGQSYQALSRLTGGLRFSICPTGALPLVLSTLASDVIERSTACATAPLTMP